MEIKVTFTIKTRLSDTDIKNSILDNKNWSFAKEEDVDVWSPVSILPTDILPAQEIKNFPHVTFIDIHYDPDFQDFDELAAFIENKFDESEEHFYDRGWFNDPDIPLSVGDFDDKTYDILDQLVKAQEMVKKVSTELAAVKARFIEEPKTAFYAVKENSVVAEFTCAMCDRKYEVRFEDCEHFLTKDCIGLKYKCPRCSRVNTTTECRHIKND